MTTRESTLFAAFAANLRNKAAERIDAGHTGDAAILTWVADAADDTRSQALAQPASAETWSPTDDEIANAWNRLSEQGFGVARWGQFDERDTRREVRFAHNIVEEIRARRTAPRPETPAQGSDGRRFVRGGDPANETCLGCGKRIRYHFGGTDYRCDPLPASPAPKPEPSHGDAPISPWCDDVREALQSRELFLDVERAIHRAFHLTDEQNGTCADVTHAIFDLFGAAMACRVRVVEPQSPARPDAQPEPTETRCPECGSEYTIVMGGRFVLAHKHDCSRKSKPAPATGADVGDVLHWIASARTALLVVGETDTAAGLLRVRATVERLSTDRDDAHRHFESAANAHDRLLFDNATLQVEVDRLKGDLEAVAGDRELERLRGVRLGVTANDLQLDFARIREIVNPRSGETVVEAVERLTKERASGDGLRTALQDALKLCRCRGTDKYTRDCTLCGDSTYDHECNDEERDCTVPACVAARRALAAPVEGARDPIDAAMAEGAYAFVRTVQVGTELHTMHIAPADRRDHDNGPWLWSCGCPDHGPSIQLPFVGVEYDTPEDGWRAVDEWEQPPAKGTL